MTATLAWVQSDSLSPRVHRQGRGCSGDIPGHEQAPLGVGTADQIGAGLPAQHATKRKVGSRRASHQPVRGRSSIMRMDMDNATALGAGQRWIPMYIRLCPRRPGLAPREPDTRRSRGHVCRHLGMPRACTVLCTSIPRFSPSGTVRRALGWRWGVGVEAGRQVGWCELGSSRPRSRMWWWWMADGGWVQKRPWWTVRSRELRRRVVGGGAAAGSGGDGNGHTAWTGRRAITHSIIRPAVQVQDIASRFRQSGTL